MNNYQSIILYLEILLGLMYIAICLCGYMWIKYKKRLQSAERFIYTQDLETDYNKFKKHF